MVILHMYKYRKNYVGKTDRCLYTRIKEHSSLDSSEIYNHIISCNEFNFVINLLELTPNDEVNNIKCLLTDLIFTNTKIIDKSNHWSLILYQESIAINRMKPSLNNGTKASKDLLIFNYNRILLLHYIYLYICNIIIIHFLIMTIV